MAEVVARLGDGELRVVLVDGAQAGRQRHAFHHEAVVNHWRADGRSVGVVGVAGVRVLALKNVETRFADSVAVTGKDALPERIEPVGVLRLPTVAILLGAVEK